MLLAVQNAVLHSLLHGIEQGLRKSLPETDGATQINTHIGAVVFIHRFGGLLNAHLALHSLRSHFHVVMIDGVFCEEEAGHLRFQETYLTAEQMTHLQRTIRQRIVRLFVRRGLLDKAEGQAMITCEHDGGFSLDTRVRIEAHDRQGLERLLRYCARPAFAQERLRQLDPEHLVYESKKPGPGGKVSVRLTPHQLLDRLSALIPPPRRHRHRYYGVLAPNSPWRSAVTALAAAPESPETATDEAKAEAETEDAPVRQAARFVWALLLARIYDRRKSLWDEVFPLICPKCGGTMKIIAFIDEGDAVRKILAHLGEPVDPPSIAPAHGPPLWETAGAGDDELLIQPLPEYEFDQRIAW